jgi:hypothetical protein
LAIRIMPRRQVIPSQGLLSAGPLDTIDSSHKANGINPASTIELFRLPGSNNIDAIQIYYTNGVHR